MNKEERKKILARFFGANSVFTLDSGESKRIKTFGDMDTFVTVFVHRKGDGGRRVFCPRSWDETKACKYCDAGDPQGAVAAAPIYNFTDKRSQVALWSGPKRGPLAQVYAIFNATGPDVVMEVSKEGSGRQTTYSFVPVVGATEVIPPEAKALTREEILSVVEQVMGGGEEEW